MAGRGAVLLGGRAGGAETLPPVAGAKGGRNEGSGRRIQRAQEPGNRGVGLPRRRPAAYGGRSEEDAGAAGQVRTEPKNSMLSDTITSSLVVVQIGTRRAEHGEGEGEHRQKVQGFQSPLAMDARLWHHRPSMSSIHIFLIFRLHFFATWVLVLVLVLRLQLKLGSMKLAKEYMNRVVTSVKFDAFSDDEELMEQGVRFAYRVHQVSSIRPQIHASTSHAHLSFFFLSSLEI